MTDQLTLFSGRQENAPAPAPQPPAPTAEPIAPTAPAQGVMLYIRLSDDTWTRLGEVHSRYVYVQTQRNGQWTPRLAPVNRKHIQSVIEQYIKMGSHLSGSAYRLTEVTSTLTEEERARLKELHSGAQEEEL